MFLARQLPLQRGFRGAPSVYQGGSGPPGATFTGPTFASLPWGPCGGANAGRVVDRAPTGSSGRRGGGTGGAGSPVLAAPTGQGGSCARLAAAASARICLLCRFKAAIR